MKVFLFLTLAVTTCVPTLSQTPSRRTTNARIERGLITLSKKAVKGLGTANIVVDDRFTGTTSAVVQPGSGKLLHPKVTIAGDRALVTGLVVFEVGSPQGRTKENSSPVKIDFTKRDGQWKFAGLCLGACGPISTL